MHIEFVRTVLVSMNQLPDRIRCDILHPIRRKTLRESSCCVFKTYACLHMSNIFIFNNCYSLFLLYTCLYCSKWVAIFLAFKRKKHLKYDQSVRIGLLFLPFLSLNRSIAHWQASSFCHRYRMWKKKNSKRLLDQCESNWEHHVPSEVFNDKMERKKRLESSGDTPILLQATNDLRAVIAWQITENEKKGNRIDSHASSTSGMRTRPWRMNLTFSYKTLTPHPLQLCMPQ